MNIDVFLDKPITAAGAKTPDKGKKPTGMFAHRDSPVALAREESVDQVAPASVRTHRSEPYVA